MMNSAHDILDPIYNTHIYLWHGDKFKMAEWSRKKLGLTTGDINAIISLKCAGQMIPLSDGSNMLWLHPQLQPDDPLFFITLAHECFHVTCRVMKSRGVLFGHKSEEAFAYHQSWLMAQVLEKLKIKSKKKRTIKNA